MRIMHFTKSVAGLNKKGMMLDGGKHGVSHPSSERPPVVQVQRLKLSLARLFDHCSGHHGAATDHVFQPSIQTRSQQMTGLDVSYVYYMRPPTTHPCQFLLQRWVWREQSLIKVKQFFKSFRHRCPQTPKTNNVAELIPFKLKTRRQKKEKERQGVLNNNTVQLCIV